jgi:hypothetical protein
VLCLEVCKLEKNENKLWFSHDLYFFYIVCYVDKTETCWKLKIWNKGQQPSQLAMPAEPAEHHPTQILVLFGPFFATHFTT